MPALQTEADTDGAQQEQPRVAIGKAAVLEIGCKRPRRPPPGSEDEVSTPQAVNRQQRGRTR